MLGTGRDEGTELSEQLVTPQPAGRPLHRARQ